MTKDRHCHPWLIRQRADGLRAEEMDTLHIPVLARSDPNRAWRTRVVCSPCHSANKDNQCGRDNERHDEREGTLSMSPG